MDSIGRDSSPVEALLARELAELGASVGLAPSAVPLPARTAVSVLALVGVAAASRAAARYAGVREQLLASEPLDPVQIAAAFRSDRHLRIDGESPKVWGELSGFFRSADGWVRTHGTYPHHASRLVGALGLPSGSAAPAVAARMRELPAADAAARVTAAGGLCVVVTREHAAADEALRAVPLIRVSRTADAPRRAVGTRDAAAPLRGIRVLDLTRVIAGPVATRTLALWGADVLRIDPPDLAEPVWQHLDTGHGKRSALLDLAQPDSRAAFEGLLAQADVVVTGYRARALARLGLSPAALVERRPGLIVARLTAWGSGRADDDRRGFDSLVQAASGIAWIESIDGERPGVLPAQALDHSAGYLLAAGVITALDRQRSEGGGWLVETSLRRVAAELLGLPRTAQPSPEATDQPPALQRFDVAGTQLITAAPAVGYAGSSRHFAPPRPWGCDAAAWR